MVIMNAFYIVYKIIEKIVERHDIIQHKNRREIEYTVALNECKIKTSQNESCFVYIIGHIFVLM